MLVRLLVLALLVSWAVPPTARGAPWRAPVDGELAAGFAYSPARPFAAGARRGVDLVASEGTTVRAACTGRVSFAGRLPSGGRGLSVRCGRLTATHLGLGAVAVRRGVRVHAGVPVGVAGPGGVVRLGARVTARRFGWVDPLALIGDVPSTPPAAPLGRAPRSVAPRPAPAPLVHRTPRPAVAEPPAAPTVPVAAWAGLGLLAAGVPLGGVARRRRRERRSAPLVSDRCPVSSRSSWR